MQCQLGSSPHQNTFFMIQYVILNVSICGSFPILLTIDTTERHQVPENCMTHTSLQVCLQFFLLRINTTHTGNFCLHYQTTEGLDTTSSAAYKYNSYSTICHSHVYNFIFTVAGQTGQRTKQPCTNYTQIILVSLLPYVQ